MDKRPEGSYVMFMCESKEKHQVFPGQALGFISSAGTSNISQDRTKSETVGTVVPRNIFTEHATSYALEPTKDPITL